MHTVEKGVQKVEQGVKLFLDRGKPKNEGEGETTRPQDAGFPVASGSGDDANATGVLHSDGEAAAAGEVGAVDVTLAASGAVAVMTPNVEGVWVPTAPEEIETRQEPPPLALEHHTASASSAMAHHSPFAETTIALQDSDENRPTTSHAIEDALVVTGTVSGAIQLGDSSRIAIEVSEREPDTTGSAPQAHVGAVLLTPTNNLSVTASTVVTPDLVETDAPCSVIQGVDSNTAPSQGMALSAVDKATAATNSSKAWGIAKGTFKTALGLAVALVPEPFKGPVQAVQKVVGTIEVCVSSILVLCPFLNHCLESQFKQ
jgi:hypothetical protein